MKFIRESGLLSVRISRRCLLAEVKLAEFSKRSPSYGKKPKRVMDRITEFRKEEKITSSNFVKPFRVHFNQDGKKRCWDCVHSHDSVAILIHNTNRNVFIFVKQFRPAVFIRVAEGRGETGSTVDTDKIPGHCGLTYEMCAGIVDKDCSLVEIAKMEVLEECGYDVPIEAFENITTARSGVGTSGSLQTLFYVQVTDEMKTSAGGGNPLEGEFIETVEVPVEESLEFAMDTSKERPVAMVYGVTWYHMFKANKTQVASSSGR